MSLPSSDQMERVVATSDPFVRNLRITQAYAELSTALRVWSGSAANWCTFATWASKQAGRTIRGEDLPRLLEERLALSPEFGDAVQELGAVLHRLGTSWDAMGGGRRLWQALRPAAAFARAGAAVARGNSKVFAELGPVFARFVTFVPADTPTSRGEWEHFIRTLHPGPSPDGQDPLRDALGAYRAARAASSSRERLQWTLLGNLLVGRHEQVRLQPEIQAALDAAGDEAAAVRQRLQAAFLPGAWNRFRAGASRWWGRPLPLDRVVDRLVFVLNAAIRAIITEHLMTLALPGGRALRLGRDLPEPFPDELRSIDLPALRDLLRLLDRTPDSITGTGARDWSKLPERLHYIADLFRCHALDPALFEPPFEPEQVQALARGERPAGRL